MAGEVINQVFLADGRVLMSVTDTTATPETVQNGRVFYASSGVRSVGTMNIKLDEAAAYPEYDDSESYSAGDICTHDGKIYVCDGATAGVWDEAKWTEKTLEEFLDEKVDKESGKGLSTNDFTTAEKEKLAGIAEGATANIGTITGITMNGASKGTSGIVDLGTVITEHQDISGKVDKVEGKGLSTNDYTDAEKTKLAGVAEGATANVGTITGITMNGASKGTSGVVDLGTVITQHQDISGKVDVSEKGEANGIAELDENGKVPAAQLPGFVDDVVDGYYYNNKFYKESTHETEIPGEAGKVYIDVSTNITYRWSGSTFVPIGSDLALGETSSTAYRGDRGAAAYAAAVTNVDTTPTEGSTHLITSGGVAAAIPDISTKADKADTVLDTTLSRGRKANTTVAVRSLAFGNDVEASNMDSQAFGNNTIASGYASHAEGTSTTASGAQSHSEGISTTASGNNSHSEGSGTTASGAQSHAEGQGTKASNQNAHAEGYYTTASGTQSHAEGNGTTSSGSYSHAEGISTVASGNESHAEGQGGTYTFNGTTYTSGAKGTADHSEGYQCLTEQSMPGNHAEGYWTRATGGGAHSEGQLTLASGLASHAEGNGTVASQNYAHAEGQQTTASNYSAHSEGYLTTASGEYSHSEGRSSTASGNNSHAEGTGTTASGLYSHSEGYSSTSSGQSSHAEGQGGTYTFNGTTYTSGAKGTADHSEGYQCLTESNMPGNHAEGYWTRATGGAAHSEGYWTLASGLASHAEGASTVASQNYAHAEGQQTVAAGASSHVSGQFNVADSYSNWPEWVANTSYSVGDKVKRTSGSSVSGYICKTANSDSTFTSSKWTAQNGKMNYAEIIGNGLDVNNKSNARALDWDGNERLKGNIYVGCNADSTGGTMLTPPVAMTGATSSAAGTAGYVPAPAAGDDEKFLRGDGTWADAGGGESLPSVSDSDNGKVLQVSNGEWSVEDALSGFYTKPATGIPASDLASGVIPDVSGFYTKPSGGIPNSDLATPPAVMTGATSSAAGTAGYAPAPATTDVDKFLAGDGTYKSGGKPMVVLSYGNSTWNDFINAYNNNVIVYCRASSNSNPGTGAQNRLAFMAYVNNSETPTEVEFQYYRSMSSHSATAMGDEVYVYKLTNSNGGTWSVTTRKASIKEIAVASGSKLSVSWSSDKVTLSNTMTASDLLMTGATSSAAGTAGTVPAPAAGDQMHVLMGDGTWDIAPGARIFITNETITNTSGAYTWTFTDEYVTEDMVALRIEVGTPSVFHDNIVITPGNGEYTVSCDSVSGTSTLKVYFAKQQQNPTAITSTEFDILNNRLLAVENVYTNTSVTIATTDWTLANGVYTYTWSSQFITEQCGVEVILRDGAENAGISGFNYDKVTGGVKITTTEQPTGNLPITITIINARASQTIDLNADDVGTEAISGCNTVEEALTNLDGRITSTNTNIGDLSSLTTTAQSNVVAAINELDGDIGTLNSNMKVYSLSSSEHLLTWAESATNVPAYSQRLVYPGDTDGTDLPNGNSYKLYSVARIIKASSSAITVELIPYSGVSLPIMYNTHTANGWAGWSKRYNKSFARAVKTYTNITIGSNGYQKFDDFNGAISGLSEVDSSWYLVSMTFRGWNSATLPLSIMKGTNGTDFYITGAPQTLSSFTVEYYFANANEIAVS